MSVNWKDDYYKSERRVVLTNEQLHIPGLRTFGMHDMQNAVPPLCSHYHENAFEITFVTQGNIIFYADDKEYRSNGGDAFIAFPNEVHSTHGIPMSVGKIYWIQLDISDPQNFLFFNHDAASSLISKLSSIRHHNIRTDNKEIQSLITKSFSLSFTPGNELIIASYLTIYLHLLIRFSYETQFPLTPDIGTALTYIMDHITSEISLDDLANYSHLSTSHFKQKFKNQMGISPRNFINQQKIEHAKTLLQDGYSITEVSMILGFSSSSYFAYTFKKFTAFTPTEYILNTKLENENKS